MPGQTRRKRSKGRSSSHPNASNSITSNNINSTTISTTSNTTTRSTTAVILKESHKNAATITHSYNRAVRVKRDYCNRINRIIMWLEEHYTGHATTVVVPISPEMRDNTTRFFYKNEKDLEYHKLHYPVIEAFLGEAKLYEDGTHYSYSQIRKYYDAILFGAEQTEKYLTIDFSNRMDRYFDCLKKEKSNAKQEGNLETEEADPISQALYEQICRWAVRENCMFVWVYTVMLWNCMARSINIEALSTTNMKRGASESVQWTYDKSKADQKGEKVRQ